MSEIRIGATERAPDSPAFAVSRDAAGILIGVRDKAAPQFAVSRDSDGLLLSAWPSVPPAVPVAVEILGGMEGFVRSSSADWMVARTGAIAGANVIAVPADPDIYPYIGQQFIGGAYGGYYIYQTCWSFDTSVIPDDAAVAAVDLRMFPMFYSQSLSPSFLVEARAHEWGETLTAADFVAGDDLAAKTLLASIMSLDLYTGGLVALSSEGAFAGAVNKAGFTRIVVNSARQRTGPAPVGEELAQIANRYTAGYSTRLSVTYEA